MYLFFFFTFYFAFWVFPSREYTWRHFSLRGLFARKYLNKETLVINMQKIIRGLLHTKIKFCEISFTSTQHLKKIKSWGGGLTKQKGSATIYIYNTCLFTSMYMPIFVNNDKRGKGVGGVYRPKFLRSCLYEISPT